MPIPAIPGLPPLSFDLGLGGGPSQATNNGAPNNAFGYTGPFSAGSGRGGNQSASNPITQTTTQPKPGPGPFDMAGLGDGFGTTIMIGGLMILAAIIYKKVR